MAEVHSTAAPPLPVAILAGGLATRLRPLTEHIPKILVEINGRPFAEYQLELLRAHGLIDVVLCIGYLGEQVQAALGDGSRFGMRLRYVFDGPCLLGTGGAVRAALPLLGEAFFILYGDTYLRCDYRAIERAFRAGKKPGLMAVLRNKNQWDTSNVIYANGQIIRYDKHNRVPEMEYIDYGLGILHAEVFAPYPADEPLDLATIYRDLAGRGELAGYEVDQRFYEIGSPAGLEETRRFFESL